MWYFPLHVVCDMFYKCLPASPCHTQCTAIWQPFTLLLFELLWMVLDVKSGCFICLLAILKFIHNKMKHAYGNTYFFCSRIIKYVSLNLVNKFECSSRMQMYSMSIYKKKGPKVMKQYHLLLNMSVMWEKIVYVHF
jgi:hypothetical protein